MGELTSEWCVFMGTCDCVYMHVLGDVCVFL